MNPLSMLQDKTIVVFGAAGRLGGSLVRAALGAGACVVAADANKAALEDLQRACAASDRLQAVRADIASRDSIEAALAAGEHRHGRVDGAVNSAYPRNANYGRAFLDVTYEDFCDNVSMHLGGYFLVTQTCARHAIDRGTSFSLVNMSSIYGIMAPRFEVYAGTKMTMPVEYAAIKSGLNHLTRYAAAAAKGSLFRANCVSPGGILAGQDPSFLARYDAHCRHKGMLTPDDVDGTVLFLLSDASAYITGQNIVVDDGFSL